MQIYVTDTQNKFLSVLIILHGVRQNIFNKEFNMVEIIIWLLHQQKWKILELLISYKLHLVAFKNFATIWGYKINLAYCQNETFVKVMVTISVCGQSFIISKQLNGERQVKGNIKDNTISRSGSNFQINVPMASSRRTWLRSAFLGNL